MLRRSGYAGPVTIVDREADSPYDRPNLSKDYLAGEAQDEWIPLRPAGFYEEHRIEIVRASATAIDVAHKRVQLDNGRGLEYGRLLLALGADPIRLTTPGADLPHVYQMQTYADARAIIAALGAARRAVIIGAGFIGLEVAASLRTRGLEVHVVAPDAVPFARTLGAEMGGMVRALHEARGVVFHLGRTPARIETKSVLLDDRTSLAADIVVVGIGVRPRTGLAERAGLATDRGVLVNEYLETSARDIYAAGDLARWPDARTGVAIRVEHWVVAESQGQTAARNILGARERFTAVPFFWSSHYNAIRITYVGHAEQWDRVDVSGDLAAMGGEGEGSVAYRSGGKTLAVASVGQDVRSLKAELALARGDDGALARIVPAVVPSVVQAGTS
jgi:3-phenylpropionate/trans-cinnamate dioxygenase ferredoxin reductase subunit